MDPDDDLVRESTAHLRTLSSGLVALEREEGEADVADLFRAAHSLKGNCAMAGLDVAAELAHAVEDFLDAVRADAVQPASPLVDASLDAVDEIERRFASTDGTADADGNADAEADDLVSSLRERIEAHRTDAPPSVEDPTDADDGPTGPALEFPQADPDEDLSIEEAMERASVFDDVDALVEEMGDAAAFEGIEGSGTFDEVDAGADAGGNAPDGDETDSEEPAPADDAEAPDHVADDGWTFGEIKSTVDDRDVDRLERDLEAVEFGEFDDDEMSIDELIELDGEPDPDPSEGGEEPQASPEADGPGAEPQDVPGERAADSADPAPRADSADGDPIDAAGTGERAPETDASSAPAETEIPSAPAEAEDGDRADAPAGDDAADDFWGEVPDTGEGAGGEDAGADSIDEAGEIADVDLELDLEDLEATDAEIEFARDDRVVEFEERFGSLFGADLEGRRSGTPDAVGTIAESRLPSEPFESGGSRPDGDRPAVSDGLNAINVDVDVADDLLNLVEELSMARLRLEDGIGPSPDAGVEDALSQLESALAGFRRSVTDLRLVSLSPAVEGLPRVVRDIARDQDKAVAFDIEGEGVRLDRSVVDRIGEPLLHLVRNAVDHGIEPPDEREAAGKPREGRVSLRAERVRDRVVIEIEDDGRGIDRDDLLETAVEAGVVTADEAGSISEDEVYDLLFHHGLSTREEVTDVSGRGVGMDIVKRTIGELEGTIDVESESGAGTTFRLRLPVTVAMDRLLFVSAGGEQYAIPVSTVEHVGDPDRIERVDGREVVPPPPRTGGDGVAADGGGDDGPPGRADEDDGPAGADEADGDGPDRLEPAGDADDGTGYPLIRLGDAFDGGDRPVDGGRVLWIRPETARIALLCDDVSETRDAVVTPYGPPIDGVPGISGATILGDGRVVNIIDVTTIA